jgi:hypothetical protein
MTASRNPPARLPAGVYHLRPEFFKQATSIKATIHVEQAEFGYLVDGSPARRPFIEKYYAPA